MSLDGAQLTFINADGVAVAHAVKGCKFSVGSSLACNLVLHSAERLHCEIESDAFGRVTIYNHSTNEPIQLNDQIVISKRPLLDGARIKIMNENYTWNFQRDDDTITPDRNPPRPAPHSSSSYNGPRQRRHLDNRLTFHNFRHSINSDDEGNTSIESRELKSSSFSNVAEATEPSAESKCNVTTPADEMDETIPKVDLLEATQNKENTSTPGNKLMLQLCARSDVVITSFSPRVTGIKTEKSFTCVLKPSTAVALSSTTTTPKSVYNTPKGVLSELNDDSCSRELMEFSTPSTSKKALAAKRKTSMYLIDLTTPQKQRQTLGTPGSPLIISVNSTDESGSDASIIDITTDSPAKQKQGLSLKKPKEQLLAASSTPKRTPQSLMKRAILTSAKKQISTNCRTPNDSQHLLQNARRQCLTAPRRLPFHPRPKWRTQDRPQIPTLSGRKSNISPRKRQSTPLSSPRDTKVSSMRKSLAVAIKTSPNVSISNKLVAKARRALNSPKRLNSPKSIESPKSLEKLQLSPNQSSIQDENNSSAELSRTFTINDDHSVLETIADLVTGEGDNKVLEKSLAKAQSKVLNINESGAGATAISQESCELKAGEVSIKETLNRTFDANVSQEKKNISITTNTQTLEEPSTQLSTVETKNNLTNKEATISVENADQVLPVSAAAVDVIEDYICEEVPTSATPADAASPIADVHLLEETICEELPTSEDNTPTAANDSVSLEHDEVAPPGATPIPRRSTRRISIEQSAASLTPRRSTRLSSVDAGNKLESAKKPTRRASCSACVDGQRNEVALATPKRKRRLTEDMSTPTRKSKRLSCNTPKRAFQLDESVGDMGVIVEEEADKLPVVTDEAEFGSELPTVDADEPDKIDYQGMKELLKTPKSCSTPHFKGLREMMRTPKMQSSLVLDNIEELLETNSNDASSTTPRREITVARTTLELTQTETTGDAQDLYFKTPRGKNLMIPNEPASAVLKTADSAFSTKTEYDLNATNDTLHLDKIFDDVLTEDTTNPVIAINDSESEMNVTAISTATDITNADPLSTTAISTVALNDTVASEALMNIEQMEKSHKDPLTSTAYKPGSKTELDDECYTQQTKSPGICDVSGIQMLDQTTDSMFSEPLMVSGVDSPNVTVSETKATLIVNVTPQTPKKTPGRNTSDADSTVGLTEPLVLSDDEEDLEVLSCQNQTIGSNVCEESTKFDLELTMDNQEDNNITKQTSVHCKDSDKSIKLNDLSQVGSISELPSVDRQNDFDETDLSTTNKSEFDIDLETSGSFAATDKSLAYVTNKEESLIYAVSQKDDTESKKELELTNENAEIVDESFVLQAAEDMENKLIDSNQLDKSKETRTTTDLDLTNQIEDSNKNEASDKGNDDVAPKEEETKSDHSPPTVCEDKDTLTSAETSVKQSTTEVSTDEIESVTELNTLGSANNDVLKIETQADNKSLSDNKVETQEDAEVNNLTLEKDDRLTDAEKNLNILNNSEIKPQSTKISEDQCNIQKNNTIAINVLSENKELKADEIESIPNSVNESLNKSVPIEECGFMHNVEVSVEKSPIETASSHNESLTHNEVKDLNQSSDLVKEDNQQPESNKNGFVAKIDDEAKHKNALTEPKESEESLSDITAEAQVVAKDMSESVIDQDEVKKEVETKIQDEVKKEVEINVLSTSVNKSLLEDNNSSKAEVVTTDNSLYESVEVIDSSAASNEVIPTSSIIDLDELEEEVETKILSTSADKSILENNSSSKANIDTPDDSLNEPFEILDSTDASNEVIPTSTEISSSEAIVKDESVLEVDASMETKSDKKDKQFDVNNIVKSPIPDEAAMNEKTNQSEELAKETSQKSEPSINEFVDQIDDEPQDVIASTAPLDAEEANINESVKKPEDVIASTDAKDSEELNIQVEVQVVADMNESGKDQNKLETEVEAKILLTPANKSSLNDNSQTDMNVSYNNINESIEVIDSSDASIEVIPTSPEKTSLETINKEEFNKNDSQAESSPTKATSPQPESSENDSMSKNKVKAENEIASTEAKDSEKSLSNIAVEAEVVVEEANTNESVIDQDESEIFSTSADKSLLEDKSNANIDTPEDRINKSVEVLDTSGVLNEVTPTTAEELSLETTKKHQLVLEVDPSVVEADKKDDQANVQSAIIIQKDTAPLNEDTNDESERRLDNSRKIETDTKIEEDDVQEAHIAPTCAKDTLNTAESSSSDILDANLVEPIIDTKVEPASSKKLSFEVKEITELTETNKSDEEESKITQVSAKTSVDYETKVHDNVEIKNAEQLVMHAVDSSAEKPKSKYETENIPTKSEMEVIDLNISKEQSKLAQTSADESMGTDINEVEAANADESIFDQDVSSTVERNDVLNPAKTEVPPKLSDKSEVNAITEFEAESAMEFDNSTPKENDKICDQTSIHQSENKTSVEEVEDKTEVQGVVESSTADESVLEMNVSCVSEPEKKEESQNVQKPETVEVLQVADTNEVHADIKTTSTEESNLDMHSLSAANSEPKAQSEVLIKKNDIDAVNKDANVKSPIDFVGKNLAQVNEDATTKSEPVLNALEKTETNKEEKPKTSALQLTKEADSNSSTVQRSEAQADISLDNAKDISKSTPDDHVQEETKKENSNWSTVQLNAEEDISLDTEDISKSTLDDHVQEESQVKDNIEVELNLNVTNEDKKDQKNLSNPEENSADELLPAEDDKSFENKPDQTTEASVVLNTTEVLESTERNLSETSLAAQAPVEHKTESNKESEVAMTESLDQIQAKQPEKDFQNSLTQSVEVQKGIEPDKVSKAVEEEKTNHSEEAQIELTSLKEASKNREHNSSSSKPKETSEEKTSLQSPEKLLEENILNNEKPNKSENTTTNDNQVKSNEADLKTDQKPITEVTKITSESPQILVSESLTMPSIEQKPHKSTRRVCAPSKLEKAADELADKNTIQQETKSVTKVQSESENIELKKLSEAAPSEEIKIPVDKDTEKPIRRGRKPSAEIVPNETERPKRRVRKPTTEADEIKTHEENKLKEISDEQKPKRRDRKPSTEVAKAATHEIVEPLTRTEEKSPEIPKRRTRKASAESVEQFELPERKPTRTKRKPSAETVEGQLGPKENLARISEAAEPEGDLLPLKESANSDSVSVQLASNVSDEHQIEESTVPSGENKIKRSARKAAKLVDETAERPPQEEIAEASGSRAKSVTRRGRKATTEEDVEPVQPIEKTSTVEDKPKRRGRKASISVEVVQETQPQLPQIEEIEKEPVNIDTGKSVQETPVSPLATTNEQQIEESSVPNAETKNSGGRAAKLVNETSARPPQEKVAESSGSRAKSVTRRGRKATTEEDVEPVQLVEKTSTVEDKPKRRGRKASISVEVVQETQPQLPQIEEIGKAPVNIDSAKFVQETPVSPLATTNVSDEHQIEEPTVPNAENKIKRSGRKAAKLVDERVERLPQEEIAEASGSRAKSVTRRGRKATTEEDVEPVQSVEKTSTVEEKPKRRGRKASISVEVVQETQPQLLQINEIEAVSATRGKSAPRRGRKRAADANEPASELADLPQDAEVVPDAVKSVTKRGRKATTEVNEQRLEEPASLDVDNKVKRRKHSISVEVTPQPALVIESSTEKPTKDVQNPSAEVEQIIEPVEADAAKKPAIRGRKPSVAVETTKEELPQTKKTTTRRARKVSLTTDDLDKQLNVQELPTEPIVNAVIVSPRAQPANSEDESQPRRREGRNLPRKNYNETIDFDKLGSARKTRKPAASKLAANKPAQTEAVAQPIPTTPLPAKIPVEPEEPKTPIDQAIKMPEQTTSQRREGRNVPRKNYDETSDEDKPASSRGRRARKPATKAVESVAPTSATERRKGKLAVDADPDEPPEKKIAEATSPVVIGKARGAARRKVNVVDDLAESSTPEPTSSKRGARSRKEDTVEEKPEQKQPAKRKVKAIEEALEEQPINKKVRGARAKTPAITEPEKTEQLEDPLEVPATKRAAAPTRRGRALRTTKVDEVEPMQETAPVTTTRTGRGRKVHFEAAEETTTAAKEQQPVAEAETTSKRANSRRK